MFSKVTEFIRSVFIEPDQFIPLHEPRFWGNEKKYIIDAIDSTYVSSVGKYVNQFEDMVKDYTGSAFAIATCNGTSALHMSLILAGVKKDDLVITQPLSFIATCNAITYIGAEPLFVDIDQRTLGLCADKLEDFFKGKTRILEGICRHIATGKKISACVPMHTFGHPTEIERIAEICLKYSVPLVEDAAESLGSTYKGQHTGTFGLVGAISLNGNKTITSGGGGVIITNDLSLAKLGKHLTTQAKVPHQWEFVHDQIGYNYRMPNLNAALACAQMEQLQDFILRKRELAGIYKSFFLNTEIQFITEPQSSFSNYWLNSVLLKSRSDRDAFLEYSNLHKVMTRPVWRLLNTLEMFKDCICEDITEAEWVADRLVNIPSSVK